MNISNGFLFIAICSVAGSACSGDSAESTPVTADAGSEAISGPHRVVIRMLDDMTFDPPVARITAGDTVVWINDGAVPHTTTADPSAAGNPDNVVLPQGASTWDSKFLNSGETFEQVMTVVGDYTYLCTLHEAAGMVGRLEVVTSDAAPDDSAN